MSGRIYNCGNHMDTNAQYKQSENETKYAGDSLSALSVTTLVLSKPVSGPMSMTGTVVVPMAWRVGG